MATAPQSRVRTGGVLTTFTFGGQPIAFCQQVAHQSPQPVGQGMSVIQPMDEPYPIEIITPVAAGAGQITLNIFELFGSGGTASKIWDALGASITGSSPSNPFADPGNGFTGGFGTGPFTGATDIVEIFIRQAQMTPDKLQVVKIIRPLAIGGNTAAQTTPYTEEYHGCVITNVIDGEQIQVSTLEVIKQITISYRYMTRNGAQNIAFNLRDNVSS
jgi:hypothetical protein